MTKQNFTQKSNGDTLSASEWNNLTSYVNTAVDAINAGGGSAGTIDTSGIISVSSKGNVTVGSNKTINLEPAWDNNESGYTGNYGDVAIKAGDDIQFCSHHREPKKRDKIVVKNIDGSDNPVKLQLVAGEIDLAVGTTSNPKSATMKKDKTTGADTADHMFKSNDYKVMDVRVLTGSTLDAGTDNDRIHEDFEDTIYALLHRIGFGCGSMCDRSGTKTSLVGEAATADTLLHSRQHGNTEDTA